MHETVDGMLEEFEKASTPFDLLPNPFRSRSKALPLLLTLTLTSPAHPHLFIPTLTSTSTLHPPPLHQAGISFQGCLYSFVFCLLVYAWSEASPTAACVLLITATALFTVYSMIARTNEVETTFPLYSIPLVSGAFFNKKAGSGAASDPAASIQAEAQATDPPSATSTPAAARPPARVAVPPPRSRGGKERSMAGGHEAREAGGTPVLMADRAPALPPAIAARHAEQQRLVAEARVRSVERKAADKEAGSSRQKDGKWFTRLRDR